MMIRKNFFTNLRQNHLEKKQKLELTKKLTIILSVIEFLDLFLEQIKLNKRTTVQKKQLKDLLFKIEKMVDKMA